MTRDAVRAALARDGAATLRESDGLKDGTAHLTFTDDGREGTAYVDDARGLTQVLLFAPVVCEREVRRTVFQPVALA
jgi:hypothetical protein